MLNWNSICNSKKDGGLGIFKSYNRNLSLCTKLAWRMNVDQHSVWSKICRYQISLSSANTSSVGKCIATVSSILKAFNSKIIFSGKTTSFWFYSWLPQGTLRSLIHGPLQNSDSNLKVSDFLNSDGSWNFNNISFPIPSDIFFSINSLPLASHSSQEDKNTWSCCHNGSFVISYVYRYLDCTPFSQSSFLWIWKLHCHLRLRLFIWKLVSNALLVNSNLSLRGIPI